MIECQLALPPNGCTEPVSLPAGAAVREAILAGQRFAPEVNLTDWYITLGEEEEPFQLDDLLEEVKEPHYLWLVRRSGDTSLPGPSAAPTSLVDMPAPVFVATPGANVGPIPLDPSPVAILKPVTPPIQAHVSPPAAHPAPPPVIVPVPVTVAPPPPAAEADYPRNLTRPDPLPETLCAALIHHHPGPNLGRGSHPTTVDSCGGCSCSLAGGSMSAVAASASSTTSSPRRSQPTGLRNPRADQH
jgi:hypothetical protein